MGQIKKYRILILIVCFCLTGLALYFRPESKASVKHRGLGDVLRNVEGWSYKGFIPYDDKVVKALKLDDYINMRYEKGADNVSLYIGYYLSSKKVGAAHDPMVCFPGQGWVLSDKKTKKIVLDSGKSISYSVMTATLRQQKELVFYWFQSYDQANADTFSQKLTLLWAKITGKNENNAFVRITVPMGERTKEESESIAVCFARDFYPKLLDYIVAEAPQ